MGGYHGMPLSWPYPKYVETVPTISIRSLWWEGSGKMTSQERHEARYQRRKAKRLEKNRIRAEKYTEWDSVFGLLPLMGGYKNVSKASKDKTSTQIWMSNLTVNARKEQKKLANGTWKSPGFNSFSIKERGKWRDIQSAHISEKGIQNTFANNCFIPIIKPHLIHDNGASLKGKGTDFSLKRFAEHLEYHIQKHGLNGGIFFFDFSSYFANILHEPLLTEAGKLIMQKRMCEMYEQISCAFGKIGLGLGSQVSQISALFYPNSVDHLIKDQLGVNGYGRHMDDGYIICDSIERLKEIAGIFKEKCKELGIKMNPKKCRIIKITKQFIFLKTRFFITESGKIVRRIGRETARKERHRLRCFKNFVKMGVMTYQEAFLNFHSWIMSLKRGKAFHLRLNAIRYFNELFEDYGKYFPPKLNKREYRVVAYIASIA